MPEFIGMIWEDVLSWIDIGLFTMAIMKLGS